MGRPRRSSINNPPPKSDIKISAFDDIIPRRRGSSGQDSAPKAAEPEQPKEEEPVDDTPEVVDIAEVAAAETDAEGHSSESDNQETAKQETVKEKLAEPASPPSPVAVQTPLPSVVPKPNDPTFSSEDEVDDGAADYDSDDSLYERSDFDTDSEYMSSGYSMFNAHVLEVDVESDSEEEILPEKPMIVSNQESEDEDEEVPPLQHPSYPPLMKKRMTMTPNQRRG